MRTRQRLVRALITEIVVDIDEAAAEIVLGIPMQHIPYKEPSRFLPHRSFGSIHSACLPALATDRAMEVWYHPSIA